MTIFEENPPKNGKAVTLDTDKYQSVAHPFRRPPQPALPSLPSGFPGSTYQGLLDNMPVGANDNPPPLQILHQLRTDARSQRKIKQSICFTKRLDKYSSSIKVRASLEDLACGQMEASCLSSPFS